MSDYKIIGKAQYISYFKWNNGAAKDGDTCGCNCRLHYGLVY